MGEKAGVKIPAALRPVAYCKNPTTKCAHHPVGPLGESISHMYRQARLEVPTKASVTVAHCVNRRGDLMYGGQCDSSRQDEVFAPDEKTILCVTIEWNPWAYCFKGSCHLSTDKEVEAGHDEVRRVIMHRVITIVKNSFEIMGIHILGVGLVRSVLAGATGHNMNLVLELKDLLGYRAGNGDLPLTVHQELPGAGTSLIGVNVVATQHPSYITRANSGEQRVLAAITYAAATMVLEKSHSGGVPLSQLSEFPELFENIFALLQQNSMWSQVLAGCDIRSLQDLLKLIENGPSGEEQDSGPSQQSLRDNASIAPSTAYVRQALKIYEQTKAEAAAPNLTGEQKHNLSIAAAEAERHFEYTFNILSRAYEAKASRVRQVAIPPGCKLSTQVQKKRFVNFHCLICDKHQGPHLAQFFTRKENSKRTDARGVLKCPGTHTKEASAAHAKALGPQTPTWTDAKYYTHTGANAHKTAWKGFYGDRKACMAKGCSAFHN